MRKFQKLSLFCLATVLVFAISCQKEIDCYLCNKPPLADAGADQKVPDGQDSVLLNGSASTDPDGKIVAWLWTKLTGPASFAIVNAKSPVTSLKNLVAGNYILELEVTDERGASAKDTVQIIVANTTVNRPPVADAGPDKTISLPNSTTTLDGSNSTDPDGNIASYKWSMVSGPSAAGITQANAATTQVSGLTEGLYHFELLVTDAGGLFARDTVQVTASAPPAVLSCGEANRQIINARLVPFAKLSEPSSGMAVAAAGNIIAFAGASLSGNPANYGSSAVHIYNTGTETWSAATLSAWRADIAVVAAGNKIFFAGGRLGNAGAYNYFSTVDIYDVATSKWSVAQLSQARAYIATATVGDKVFFAGGEQEWPLPVSDRVDIYNLSTGTWSTTSLSVPRNGLTAVATNNKVLFAGGSNQLGGMHTVTDVIDIYDNATGSWTTSNLNEPKTFFAGINVGNKIFWAGGYDESGNPTCKVEVRDLAAQTSATAFLFHPFSYVSHQGQNAVVRDNKIIWFATLDPLNGNATQQFNIYDLATGRWAIGMLPYKINGASVICVDDIIYVAGGSVNGRMTDEVRKLEW
ncbi:N-acetylneuraminic acid mutarotase [Cnuella takakiae]|uniref:N-acetylneuraminic acid mutarotase n=1 Tax=Cnuella takakiae TaxID=1302690 RepID=A0A1M4SBR9_9BACT|nr:kelch repeat-containing protein [Cnuella takakiae]OLY94453.1 hypothetical protein BUE76_23160 [Cnuella takakiae]SHE29497.1 N-acetylneuraminic acid mutarotase [Cnuella takakiae]